MFNSKKQSIVKTEENYKKPIRKRGRPKKQRTQEELDRIEEAKKNKLSLQQKQEIKLQIQKEREAAKKASEPRSEERFYCSNKDLHRKLLVWRNSDKHGLPIYKMVDDKLVLTETDDSIEGHEIYNSKYRYFVKIPRINDDTESFVVENGTKTKTTIKGHGTKLIEKAKEQLAKSNNSSFYKQTKDYIIHEVTNIVKNEGWAFNYDIVESRTLTNDVGEEMLRIGRKLLNHSNFRNYSQELKEDMLMFGCSKLIKGLKNYNFKFSNPFSWFTQAFWNSFLTSIDRHYKQLNIKKDLMKKLSQELQTYNGMDPRSSLNKAIKSYLGDEFSVDD